MKLFADTADLRELKELDEMGLICGITTNPTIASQTGKNLGGCSKPISQRSSRRFRCSDQVVAKDTEGMVGRRLEKLSPLEKYCGKACLLLGRR